MNRSIFADRIKNLRAGAITKVLKKAAQNNMLSLAGGHPAEEMLPVTAVKEINKIIFSHHGSQILQYGQSQGYPPLRKALVAYVKQRNISCSMDEIGISSGAQNAIDAVAKLFINKGDIVAIEPSTFFYTIQTLGLFEPQIVEIPSDKEGILPEKLAGMCAKKRIKLLYIIPNFQNPTGRTLPLERRKAIIKIAKKYNIMILEDDPYFELRYKNKDILPLKALDPQHVIYVGSLSKVFSPAMRLGYYIAPKKICDLITSIRQVNDIHANEYAQALATEYIQGGYLKKHLPQIQELYGERLTIFLRAMEKYIDNKKFIWSKPDGGLFVWVEGPRNFNSIKAYEKALQKGIAFVPGNFFYLDIKKNKNFFRLNFTDLPKEKLVTAVKKLAETINAL